MLILLSPQGVNVYMGGGPLQKTIIPLNAQIEIGKPEI